jgi:hypothetical protein
LLDHASFYYQALENNIEEVKKNFGTLEAEMVKYKEELAEAYLD